MSEPTAESTPRLATMARLKRDAVREVDLLLLPERVVKLNSTGAAILRLCDGQRTVAEIAGLLEAEFGEADLCPDVLAFIGEVVTERWVEC